MKNIIEKWRNHKERIAMHRLRRQLILFGVDTSGITDDDLVLMSSRFQNTISNIGVSRQELENITNIMTTEFS